MRHLNPVDKLLLAYLLLTGGLAFSLSNFLLVGLHLALLILVVLTSRHAPRPIRVLYPSLVVPLLYMELDSLSGLAGGRLYDPEVLAVERWLFGDPTPAMWMSEKLPWLLLSEFLHFCYLAYYPLLVLVAVRLYLKTTERITLNYLWCLQAATFSDYLIQMNFPVQGPRPLFPPLAESLHGLCWRLCHYLCGEGAAGAAAFPSGHVTFAMVVLFFCWKHEREGFDIFAPLCLGLSLCTVYGRFHYVVDAMAGTLVALVFVVSGPRLYSLMESRQNRVPSPEKDLLERER